MIWDCISYLKVAHQICRTRALQCRVFNRFSFWFFFNVSKLCRRLIDWLSLWADWLIECLDWLIDFLLLFSNILTFQNFIVVVCNRTMNDIDWILLVDSLMIGWTMFFFYWLMIGWLIFDDWWWLVVAWLIIDDLKNEYDWSFNFDWFVYMLLILDCFVLDLLIVNCLVANI